MMYAIYSQMTQKIDINDNEHIYSHEREDDKKTWQNIKNW